jgi:hypothetical protein
MQAISKASNRPDLGEARRCDGSTEGADLSADSGAAMSRDDATTPADVMRALRALSTASDAEEHVAEPRRHLWMSGDNAIALKPVGYAAKAYEEPVMLTRQENVASTVHEMHKGPPRLLFTFRGSTRVKFDVASGVWIDADGERSIPDPTRIEDLGVLPLLRPRPVLESFPDARPIPKAAFSFWVGAAPPATYLENVRHNAAVLSRFGYTFTLVMDASDAIVKQTQRAVRGSGLLGWRKRASIQVVRWSDSVRSFFDTGGCGRQYPSMVADALSNYEKIAELGFYASAADLARALLLFQSGGLYLDMDDRLPDTFDGALMADSHMVWSPYTEGTYSKSERYLNNNMLAAQAGSPIVARMISLSNERLASGGHTEMAHVAQSGAGLTDEETEGQSGYARHQMALGARGHTIFKNTGPLVLTDAVREVAPGFDRYWRGVVDYRMSVARILEHPEYLTRMAETMLPLEAAFERLDVVVPSWGHTPTPRRRGVQWQAPL